MYVNLHELERTGQRMYTATFANDAGDTEEIDFTADRNFLAPELEPIALATAKDELDESAWSLVGLVDQNDGEVLLNRTGTQPETRWL